MSSKPDWRAEAVAKLAADLGIADPTITDRPSMVADKRQEMVELLLDGGWVLYSYGGPLPREVALGPELPNLIRHGEVCWRPPGWTPGSVREARHGPSSQQSDPQPVR